MSVKNKLFIAGAGCGKTTFIIENALKIKDKKVLITTYTDNNEYSIKNKIIEKNGFIPNNIKVQTWFSFLIQHGAKPYLACSFKDIDNINGLLFVQGYNKSHPIYKNNSQSKEHYFSNDNKIYSLVLSKFVCKCNELSQNKVIIRLENIFDSIFIDEAQDLAGYDFNLLELLFNSNIKMCLVGDMRQRIYKTNTSNKNSFKNQNNKNKSYNIQQYIINNKINNCEIDEETLNKSYRNNEMICKFSSKLYSDIKPVQSCSTNQKTGHDGVFYIKTNEVNKYLSLYPDGIMQLRDKINSKTKDINNEYPVMNFGKSKGLEYDRVLIFTVPVFINILENINSDSNPEYRAKLYVAITRAKHSVTFVSDTELDKYGINKYNF